MPRIEDAAVGGGPERAETHVTGNPLPQDFLSVRGRDARQGAGHRRGGEVNPQTLFLDGLEVFELGGADDVDVSVGRERAPDLLVEFGQRRRVRA